jgi:hypothetical protein
MSDLRNATDRLADAVEKMQERRQSERAEKEKELSDLRQLVASLRASQQEDVTAITLRLNLLAEAVEKM